MERKRFLELPKDARDEILRLQADLLVCQVEPSIPLSALRQEREWLEAQYQCEKSIDHQCVYHSGAEKASELQLIRLKAEIDILSILIERYAPMRPTEDECRGRTASR